MNVESERLAGLAHELGITMSAKYEGRHVDDSDWEHDKWVVTLHRGKKSLKTKFHQGTGHAMAAPSLPTVLSSLVSDADAGSESFEDFCGSFGYDEDSRKAEKIWKACKKIAPQIKRFLGSDYRAVAEAAAEY